MKNRKIKQALFLWLLTFFFIWGKAYATEVDLKTAQTVAENFYLCFSPQISAEKAKGSAVDYHFELVQQVFADSMESYRMKNTSRHAPLYYVFNVNTDDGFVIVSGNEKIKAILAYAFRGTYKKSEQSPAFEAWMENYKKQILFVLENDTKAGPGISEEWNRYKYGIQSKAYSQLSNVASLLSTRWNQNCYYNYCCPIDTTRPCSRASAGCVAVAMAQVLKFWEYPGTSPEVQGYQNAAYGWIDGFKETRYDWSMMPEELNDSSERCEIEEVSRLIYHCGVSIHTSYGPTGSFAACIHTRDALSDCFSYKSSIQFVERKNYIPEEWENLIRVELDQGRPVLYFGQNPNGIHAFVCDGYQNSGYFHFNWGWSGNQDGYYYLDDLTPGTCSLNLNQRAVVGIEPELKATDPCDIITTIGGCGWANRQIYEGDKRIYSFIAPKSGTYSIEVTDASGYINCAWKESACSEYGWNCIGDICESGEYGTMTWNAGETYYILLENKDSAPGNSHFFVSLLDSTSSTGLNSVGSLKVFPNPAKDLLNIQINSQKNCLIEITSLNGQIIYQGEMEGTTHQIDLSSHPKGIYFITIRSRDFITTRKIILS